MARKDCETTQPTPRQTCRAPDAKCHARGGVPRRGGGFGLRLPLGLVLAVAGAPAAQGEILRLWPAAVVVEDAIRLGDLCEITGAAADAGKPLAELTVSDAPPPGGSRLISLDMIREALTGAGMNMSTLTLRGARQCAVSRPAAPKQEGSSAAAEFVPSSREIVGKSVNPTDRTTPLREAEIRSPADRRSGAGREPSRAANRTLRQAVEDYFNAELARFHGAADLTFDRTSDQLLELSGPAFEFNVQRRGGSVLGLTPIEVEVVSKGRVVQTVPMVVQTAMRRQVVTARRAINQGAAVREEDVALTSVTFHRLERLGLDDPAQVIGQRAKRYLPAGAQIEAEMLESVPLVQRGELVTLTAVIGGIRVVTTAKAEDAGRRGESIKVRGVENRRVEFDAVVVGPARVEVTGDTGGSEAAMLALGGKP